MNEESSTETLAPIDTVPSSGFADQDRVKDEPRSAERPSPNWRRWRWVLAFALGLLAAAGAVGLIVLLRIPSDARNAFELMGLDPDRAQLVMALILGGLAAAVAALVSGRRGPALIAGSAVTALAFSRTFLYETHAAIRSQGAEGVFNPAGWLTTAGTLVLVSVAIAWAVAAIALSLRQSLIGAASQARRAAADRRLRSLGWVQAVAWVVMLVLVGQGFSRLGDMLNYTPDLLMRTGAPAQLGLGDPGNPVAPSSSTPGATVGPPSRSGLPVVASAPGMPALVAGPFRGSQVTAGAWSPRRPWAAWKPTGFGTVVSLPQPAPWTAANGAQVKLDVYLPPGYGTGTRRYPVTFALPWSLDLWNRSAGAVSQLDTLITSAAIPAQIVVFAAESTGPYPDTECADSFDGRVWWERYLTKQVVPMIDSTFRTIAQPAARSLFGSSMGGFCAAALLARHPDIFGSAASISGYFDAAPRSNQTPLAGRVYGGNSAMEAAWSPTLIVRGLPTAVRQRVFFVLSARPSERLYGPAFETFGSELAQLGIPVALLPNSGGHSWIGARAALGPILEMLAGRMAETGVFAGQTASPQPG